MRVASGPDNGGTCRDYRTVRVRLARSEGVARANQWLKLRKQLAGSNLVDTGQCAVRDVPSVLDGGSTPKPGSRSGGEATLKGCGVGVAMLPE